MNLLSPAWHRLKVITGVYVYGEIACGVCKYEHAVMMKTWMCVWKREKRDRFHAKTHDFHAKSSFFIDDVIPVAQGFVFFHFSILSCIRDTHTQRERGGGGEEALQCHAAAVSRRNLVDVSTKALNAAELLHKLCTTCKICHASAVSAAGMLHCAWKQGRIKQLYSSFVLFYIKTRHSFTATCLWMEVNTPALCNK